MSLAVDDICSLTVEDALHHFLSVSSKLIHFNIVTFSTFVLNPVSREGEKSVCFGVAGEIYFCFIVNASMVNVGGILRGLWVRRCRVLCDCLIVAISRTICIQNVATAAIQFAVLVFAPSDSYNLAEL